MYNKRFLIHDPESLNLIPEVYEVQIGMVRIIGTNLFCNMKMKEGIFPGTYDKYLTSLLITHK